MQAVGEIVRDDIKLGTLYVTLLLATPGEEQSPQAKVSSHNYQNLMSTHIVRPVQPWYKCSMRSPS